jgi:hypothetical protein
MKALLGLVMMVLAVGSFQAQEPGKFMVTEQACTWTMPTDEDEVKTLFKDAPINWCDDIGISKVSVNVHNDKEDGYRVKGHLWFMNKGKPSQPIWATFDLMDGDKVLAGSVLRMKMDNTGKDRESYEILSPVPVDYHITFRITLHRSAK